MEPRRVVRKALNKEEYSGLSSVIVQKIETYIHDHYVDYVAQKHIFESTNKSNEREIENLRQQNAELNEHLTIAKTNLDSAVYNVNALKEQVKQYQDDAAKANESRCKAEQDATEARNQRNQAIDERNNIKELVDRRVAEIEMLKSEITTLTEQLHNANKTKCETIVQLQDIESTRLNLEFREKQMEQERELFKNQIQALNQNINQLNCEISDSLKQSSVKIMTMQGNLDAKIEELKYAKTTIDNLKGEQLEAKQHIDSLMQKLEKQVEAEKRHLDSFKEELQSQQRLIELYKSSADDAKTHNAQLTEAVEELKRTLADITATSVELESKLEESKEEFDEQLRSKDEIIQLLKKELDEAKQEVEEEKKKKIDDVINSLSPNAAATAQMMKNGMTLSEMFYHYCRTCEELTQTKNDLRKMEEYVKFIIEDVKKKEPLFTEMYKENDYLKKENITLSKKNEEHVQAIQQMKDDHMKNIQEAASLTRENRLLAMTKMDLSRQVCSLVKEVEQLRSNVINNVENMSDTDDPTPCADSNDIISRNLVTFSNIQELQTRNAQLLQVCRDLAQKQEESDSVDPAAFVELTEKMQKMKADHQELLRNQERQTQTLNILTRQRNEIRERYEALLKSDSHLSHARKNELFKEIPSIIDPKTGEDDVAKANAVPSEDIDELKRKLHDSEQILRALKQDFDNYKNERNTNDKMTNELLEKLQVENRQVLQTNCKLMSAVEYKDEQIKVAKANMESFKKQTSTLADKCANLSGIIKSNENTIEQYRCELISAQKGLSAREVELDYVKRELQLAKDAKSRALHEKEALQSVSHSQNMLMVNIEAIKSSIERQEAEGKMRLESQNSELLRECSALRRRLQEEQDQFRSLQKHMDVKMQEINSRAVEDKKMSEKLREELTSTREELAKKTEEVNEINKKMLLNVYKTSDPISEQISELKRTIEVLTADKRELEEKVNCSKEEAARYFDISQHSEQERIAATNELTQVKEAATAKLAEYEATIKQLTDKVTVLDKNIAMNAGELTESHNELLNKIAKLESDNTQLNDELKNVKMDLEASRVEITQLNEQVQKAEEKYEHEMVNHAADIQVLTGVKEELFKLNRERDELKMNADKAIEALAIHRQKGEQYAQMILDEKKEVELRLGELDKQNALLHGQLEALSTQLQLNVANESANDTNNLSSSLHNVSDVEPSTELMQVIKYLRKEKSITVTKLDILQSENARLTSQFDILRNELDETKKALNEYKMKESTEIVSLSKHNDVLRKIETLNAITDSNRILRNERDELVKRIEDVQTKINALEEQLAPVQEKNKELDMKVNELQNENTSLRSDLTKWRTRANTLVERSNKSSPEDWRRLQNERENLVKMVQAEKEASKKANEAKAKLEVELTKLQKQSQTNLEQIKKLTEELTNVKQQNLKLVEELNERRADVTRLTEENKKVYEECQTKAKEFTSLSSKYTTVRALAVKYKNEVAEQNTQMTQQKADSEKTQEQTKEDVRRELNEKFTAVEKELTEKINELKAQNAKLAEENKTSQADFNTRNERSQNVLRSCKSKIQLLNERIAQLEKDKADLQSQLQSEKERWNRERDTMNVQISQLQKMVNSTNAPVAGTSGAGEKSVSTPPTANIKPMAGQPSTQQSQHQHSRRTGETPLASIRPMAMAPRTATTFPNMSQSPTTVAGSSASSSTVTVVVPPQQQVHTTGISNVSIEALSSSPTSSHTDYMPATSSVSSATVLPQATVPPTIGVTVSSNSTMGGSNCTAASGSNGAVSSYTEVPSTVAESTGQDMEIMDVEAGEQSSSSSKSAQQQTSTTTVSQQPISDSSTCQQQQAVALVMPRVEQAQSQSIGDTSDPTTVTAAPSASTSLNSAAASSSNTVTTTQAGSHKRSRSIAEEGDTSSDQDPTMNPKTKRGRITPKKNVYTVRSWGKDDRGAVTSSQRGDPVISLDSDDDVIAEDEEQDDEEPDNGVNENVQVQCDADDGTGGTCDEGNEEDSDEDEENVDEEDEDEEVDEEVEDEEENYSENDDGPEVGRLLVDDDNHCQVIDFQIDEPTASGSKEQSSENGDKTTSSSSDVDKSNKQSIIADNEVEIIDGDVGMRGGESNDNQNSGITQSTSAVVEESREVTTDVRSGHNGASQVLTISSGSDSSSGTATSSHKATLSNVSESNHSTISTTMSPDVNRPSTSAHATTTPTRARFLPPPNITVSDYPHGSQIATTGLSEYGGDCIVPSTPTLAPPNRYDAFGEAINSPHVPSAGLNTSDGPSSRFTFSDHSISMTPMDTVVPRIVVDDDAGDDSETGRSVPTTPHQLSQDSVPLVIVDVVEPGEAPSDEDRQGTRTVYVMPSSDDDTFVSVNSVWSPEQAVNPLASQEAGQSDAQSVGESSEQNQNITSEGETPAFVNADVEEGREAEMIESPVTAAPRGNTPRTARRSTFRGTPRRNFDPNPYSPRGGYRRSNRHFNNQRY